MLMRMFLTGGFFNELYLYCFCIICLSVERDYSVVVLEIYSCIGMDIAVEIIR